MSSRIVDLTARVLQVERQRDELFRANLKLRDYLLARARECEACGGTGCVTVMRYAGAPLYFEGEKIERVEPCGDCHDLREVLQ